MIELDRLTKTYPTSPTPAVQDVSLTIREGEFVVLLGASGSGKTTTLKMINRLIEPSDGRVVINDRDTAELNDVELRRSIGYVFQEIGLFPHLTIRENAALVLRLTGMAPADANERADQVLRLVDLDPQEFADRWPSELSGGQRQRVGVARALAAKPNVVLMDEPFGALDPITRAGMHDEVRKIRRETGVTIVMVTHDLSEALLLADRVGVMDEGRLIALGEPRELLQSELHPQAEALLAAPRQQIDNLAHLLGRGGTA